jgi:polyferredoxin
MKKFKYALSVQAFPKWIGQILVWSIPASELAVTGLLLFDESRLLGMYLSFIMMLAFTFYIGGVIFKVYNVYPCPCGGLFSRMGWKKHFKVNLWLTALALIGVLIMEFGKN